VAPRVLACICVMPLLTMLANVIGIGGALVITMKEVGVTSTFFYNQILDTLGVVDLVHGLMKSVFFGYLVGIIGCYVGLNTRGGTEGVGVSTTSAVVIGAISLLVSNFFLTQLFLAIYG
jgi:phospholipid/cholesterol/gamma-HCH transport system permease protein